jgi:hypothetical protein
MPQDQFIRVAENFSDICDVMCDSNIEHFFLGDSTELEGAKALLRVKF